MATIKTVSIKKVDLKKLCAKKKMSIKQLADKAGVSYEHLTRVSNNIFSMTSEYWDKLKKYL